MALREIRRLLMENQGSNVSSRMTPEMHTDLAMPNPLSIYRFLDSRARNDSRHLAFDKAVRRFLPTTVVTAARNGVVLRSQRYHSEALRDTGLLDRISTIGTQRLKAYYIPLCIRYIWVEVDNKLIEVDAQMNLRDDEETLYRSYLDLLNEDELRRQGNRELDEHSLAAIVDQKNRFKQENDAQWNAGRVEGARPKRSSEEQTSELQSLLRTS